MRTVFWMAVAFLSLIIASPIHAMEPWGVLDDFSGNLINDSIWNTSTSTNAGVTEFAREQQAGKLRLYNRTHADFASPGNRWTSWVRLLARNSEDISQIGTRMKVTRADVAPCGDASETNAIRGRIVGYFFKNGPQSGANLDATGDIFAALGVWKDSTSADLRVTAQVEECDDSQCNTSTPLLFDNTTLGTVELGKIVTLLIRWDEENDRLVFGRGGQRLVYNYSGILTDNNPPEYRYGFIGKRIEVMASIWNCSVDLRGEGLMEVKARDFLVNRSAAVPAP